MLFAGNRLTHTAQHIGFVQHTLNLTTKFFRVLQPQIMRQKPKTSIIVLNVFLQNLCQREAAGDAVDAAGDAVDKAVDAAGNAVDKAVDAAGEAADDAAKKAGEAVDKATEAAKNKVKEATAGN